MSFPLPAQKEWSYFQVERQGELNGEERPAEYLMLSLSQRVLWKSPSRF